METGELELCARLFQDAFDHYQKIHSSGFSVDATTGVQMPGGGFDAMHMLVLADLHNALGHSAAAMHAVRSGSRWLQGRGVQRYWDACEDDREFDVEGSSYAREGDPPPGMFPLDVNARHRLAIARIKNGDTGEGKVGFIVLN